MANTTLKEFVAGLTAGGSPLMNGRTKVNTADVLGIPLTMRDFDFAEFTDEAGETKAYPVIVFDELPDKYYCGGKQFTDICNGIKANGFIDALRADGLRVMLTARRTRRGQTFIAVNVVD